MLKYFQEATFRNELRKFGVIGFDRLGRREVGSTPIDRPRGRSAEQSLSLRAGGCNEPVRTTACVQGRHRESRCDQRGQLS